MADRAFRCRCGRNYSLSSLPEECADCGMKHFGSRARKNATATPAQVAVRSQKTAAKGVTPPIKKRPPVPRRRKWGK